MYTAHGNVLITILGLLQCILYGSEIKLPMTLCHMINLTFEILFRSANIIFPRNFIFHAVKKAKHSSAVKRTTFDSIFFISSTRN